MVNNSPPLLVHLQSVLQMLLTKIFHENLSAPIAVTPKNTDFDGDYLALKDFLTAFCPTKLQYSLQLKDTLKGGHL